MSSSTKSALIALISKGASFLLFLVLARYLTKNDFGTYAFIVMVIGLLPVFQFGLINGLVMSLPEAYVKKRDVAILYQDFFYLSLFLQLLGLLFIYILVDLSGQLLVLVVLVCFQQRMIDNHLIKLNGAMAFSKANALKFIDHFLKIIFVGGAFLYYQTLESLFTAQFIFNIFLLLFIGLPGLGWKRVRVSQTFKYLVRKGFLLYLVWGVDLIFRFTDRWFIEYFYSRERLAEYGFASTVAMNVWMLVLAYLMPISQKIYRFVAKKEVTHAAALIVAENKRISFFLLGFCMMVVAVYWVLVNSYLEAYQNTFHVFLILLSAAVCLSLNNLYIYFFSALGRHQMMLVVQVGILIVNIIGNLLVIGYGFGLLWLAVVTFLSSLTYMFFLRRVFKGIACE